MVVSNVFYFAEAWSLPLYSEDERFNVRADKATEADKTSRRRDRRMLHQKKTARQDESQKIRDGAYMITYAPCNFLYGSHFQSCAVMFSYVQFCSVMFTYVQLCSLMFTPGGGGDLARGGDLAQVAFRPRPFASTTPEIKHRGFITLVF